MPADATMKTTKTNRIHLLIFSHTHTHDRFSTSDDTSLISKYKRCYTLVRDVLVQTEPATWLLLLHQIPNSPPYLRVKMWRRLQKIGAVPVKNAVYVLPRSDQSIEDFHWVAREIIEAGGDASVCEATFIEGINNREVIEIFRSARETDY